jgi:probable F420-dependent oxidoreductase
MMGIVNIGIQLPEVEREVRWPEYVAMAQAAEEVGFDSIWIGDHLIYREGLRGGEEKGPWEAWTLMSALAAVTERVTIGPLVACLAFHPPGIAAKMAATIDEVGDGRFVFGVGAGWNEGEFRAFSIPHDRRVSRFEEAFTIVRRLLAGERVTFDGRFWSAEETVLLPKPKRRIPLMIGSNGPRMLSIALPHVDAWNTWYDGYGNTAEGFAALGERIGAAAIEAGRDPTAVRRSACALVVVDASVDVMERAPGERAFTEDAPPISGTAAQIASRLRELGEAGADEAIVIASPITEASIRSLGDVIAELR